MTLKHSNSNIKTHYYPFGLEMPLLSKNYATSADENRYRYNGKEKLKLKDDDNDIFWLDYGRRMYDPALGRFHTQDRFAEKYFDYTPYQYAANNPILNIDVNGDSIAGNTAAVDNLENQAKRGVAYEQKRQSNMQARADKRAANGKSTNGIERRMARSEFREGQYQSTVNEIGEMRASNNIYNINTSYVPGAGGPDGYVEYAGTNANGSYTINVNVSQSYLQAGGLAHELVHGYQFETGQLDFQSTGSPGLLYDIGDEIAAFTRQLAFAGNSNMYSVNAAFVRSQSAAFYGKLPSGPLNINTSQTMLEFQTTGKFNLLHNAPYQNLILPYTPIYNK